MTCINKNFRKASKIKKVKKRSDSNIVIKCIRNTHKLIKTNWAKQEKWFRKSIHWKNENWYEAILHEAKTLHIKEIDNLFDDRTNKFGYELLIKKNNKNYEYKFNISFNWK